jgi:hypothetical protein
MSTSALASCAGAKSESQRFGKLLRLALVADQDGEIIGAVCALKRALAAAGLDPHYIVDAFERGTSQAAPSISPDEQGDDRSTVWWCWHRRGRLSRKEAAFIETLTRWRGTISARQRQWLRDIVDKLAEAA